MGALALFDIEEFNVLNERRIINRDDGVKKLFFLLDNESVRLKDLSKFTGVKKSVLIYYTDLGLLPYNISGFGKGRKFLKEKCIENLIKIAKLKKKGYTIKEIHKIFKIKGLLHEQQ